MEWGVTVLGGVSFRKHDLPGARFTNFAENFSAGVSGKK
jgi:hypothetical protein